MTDFMKPKDDLSILHISFKPPKWLKTMWSTTVGRWFDDDDGYSLFFKAIGFLVLAPVAGFFTLFAHAAPVPFILSVLIVMIILLAIIGMATVDDCPTAKQTFWRWMTTTVVWYVMSVIGIIEMYAIRAMVM
jgi:hypothetical protein